MKISYQYTDYGACYEATRLSDLSGRLTVAAVPASLLLGVLTNKLCDSFAVGLLIGLAIFVGLAVSFKRKAVKRNEQYLKEKHQEAVRNAEYMARIIKEAEKPVSDGSKK